MPPGIRFQTEGIVRLWIDGYGDEDDVFSKTFPQEILETRQHVDQYRKRRGAVGVKRNDDRDPVPDNIPLKVDPVPVLIEQFERMDLDVERLSSGLCFGLRAPISSGIQPLAPINTVFSRKGEREDPQKDQAANSSNHTAVYLHYLSLLDSILATPKLVEQHLGRAIGIPSQV
jgi:hypothetical protein